jgi:hypothetical protein
MARKAKIKKVTKVKRVTVRKLNIPVATVVEIKVPKGSAPLVVHKAPDVIEIVTVPKEVATKQGWWDYLFGDPNDPKFK